MQKVRQNRRSSYPLNRLKELLRRWVESDYPVALDAAFKSRRDPAVRTANFIEWFQPVIKRADETLAEIFARHGIPPGEILEVLAVHKLKEPLYPPNLKSKIRSRQSRENDARKLEKAGKILAEYESILPSLFLEAPDEMNENYRLSEEVGRAAAEIRALGTASTHRPQEVHRVQCAQALAARFQERTGRACYRFVGELDWATFGAEHKSPYDFGEVGKRLIKAKLDGEQVARVAPLIL